MPPEHHTPTGGGEREEEADTLLQLAAEIGSTVINGVHDDSLEHVLVCGYTAICGDPRLARRMLVRLAERQIADGRSQATKQAADRIRDTLTRTRQHGAGSAGSEPVVSHEPPSASHNAACVAPAAQNEGPSAAPPGWKMVPVNPTDAMKAEGARTQALGGAPHMIYLRMLAAAPPSPPPVVDEAMVERACDAADDYLRKKRPSLPSWRDEPVSAQQSGKAFIRALLVGALSPTADPLDRAASPTTEEGR